MKKILLFILVGGIISANANNVIGCINNNGEKINNNLDEFVFSNIDLDNNNDTYRSVINDIYNQINNYTNINIDKIKSDSNLVIEGISSDGTLFNKKSDEKTLNKNASLGVYSEIEISLINNKDNIFKLTKSCISSQITITKNASRVDFNNFNFQDISLKIKNPYNDGLLTNIEKQIASYKNNIDWSYLTHDGSFKYDVLESDNTDFNQNTISNYYNKLAINGNVQITITFQNDLYFMDLNKTFNVNLNVENKLDTYDFKLDNINLMKNKIYNSNVFDDIYNQLSKYTKEIDSDTLQDDDNISITITEYLSNNSTVVITPDSLQYINCIAISGKIDTKININQKDQYFKSTNITKTTNIIMPKNDKKDISKIKFQDTNINYPNNKNGFLLTHFEKQIQKFAGLPKKEIIPNDLCFILKITESNGTTFQSDDWDFSVLLKDIVPGKTTIEINIDTKDYYFISENLTYTINVTTNSMIN